MPPPLYLELAVRLAEWPYIPWRWRQELLKRVMVRYLREHARWVASR